MDSKHGAAAMIDPADKQTKSLPLEQPKRGRGRPETGAALTPAQKQKAYRERQKARREELEREVHNAYATSRVDENYSEELFAELETAKAETAAAISRAEQAEADFVTLRKKLDKALATIQELKKSNVTKSAPGDGVWTPRFKTRVSRKWVNCDAQVDFEGVAWTFEATAQHVREMEEMSKGSTHWQAVREDGLIYDPRAAK